MNSNLLTIILPVYNGERYLVQAIKSILQQTYTNFELLILNDGSSDSSQIVIDSFADKRIKSIKHTRNEGLIATLNHGLKRAKGRFIARMDQDDISAPDRFEKQITFLKSSSDVAIVGSLAACIDEQNNIIQVQPVPIDSSDIVFGMYMKNCFIHGSICLDRNKIPVKYLKYPTKFTHAEDYAFWLKLTAYGIKMYNIPEVLYYWRTHNESISKVANTSQLISYSRLINMNQDKRLKFGYTEISNFFKTAMFDVPNIVTINKTKLPSNLKIDYQYVLFSWVKSIWKYKPVLSLIALVYVVILSPKTIIKNLLKIH